MLPEPSDAAARARAWRNAAHAAICDVVEPWAHGTVVRASGHPHYYDFNLVRVEDDAGISAEALSAQADAALAGLEHRRLDFDVLEAGERARSGLAALGYRPVRLVWMRFEGPVPDAGEGAAIVEEALYDAIHELRVAWHCEDFPDHDPSAYLTELREISLRRGMQVLAARDGDAFVGFAELTRDGDSAEIADVYVRREHRGRGVGTAITTAAIRAAAGARDLWIVADDEDRPKQLYARLGFRPVWTTLECTRWP